MRPAQGCTALQCRGWVWGQKAGSVLARGGLAAGWESQTNLVPSLEDLWGKGLIMWAPGIPFVGGCGVHLFIPQSLSPVVCQQLCSGLRTQKWVISIVGETAVCGGVGTEPGSGPDFQLSSCQAVRLREYPMTSEPQCSLPSDAVVGIGPPRVPVRLWTWVKSPQGAAPSSLEKLAAMILHVVVLILCDGLGPGMLSVFHHDSER